jgi:pectate lyase
LPPPGGNVVNVSTVSQLEQAVNTATPGTTILVADGTYNPNGVYLRFDTLNVVLRSAAILDGNYQTTEIVRIVASNVTIADLTLSEAYYYPIHMMSD